MPNKQVRWALVVLVALITLYMPVKSWALAEKTELLNNSLLQAEIDNGPEYVSTNAMELLLIGEVMNPSEVEQRTGEPLIIPATKDFFVLTERDLPSYLQIMEVEATAYTHTGNPTFTGVYPKIGTIAVDPKVIPLGTRMYIEGYGYGIAEDTGGLIKGEIIDLFMDTEKECFQWGRRNVTIYILE